jgi:hypothetical protein
VAFFLASTNLEQPLPKNRYPRYDFVMGKFIHTFLTLEGVFSLIVGLLIVIFPGLFAKLMLGNLSPAADLSFVQLYGALICGWGGINFNYFRTNQWHLYRGFAQGTLPGELLTVIVLLLMIVRGVVTLFIVAYLLTTFIGFTCRLLCLYQPRLSNLVVAERP